MRALTCQAAPHRPLVAIGHDDPALLAERVAQARALREHHVWQAAKAFWLDARDAPDPSRRRFAGLMGADALVDAVLVLVAASVPARSIEAVTQEDGLWNCRMRVDLASGRRSFSAVHADLAAAILETFLLTIVREASVHEVQSVGHGQCRDA